MAFFRLLYGHHHAAQRDDKGNIATDKNGNIIERRYTQGDIIESDADLCELFNSAGMAKQKFDYVREDSPENLIGVRELERRLKEQDEEIAKLRRQLNANSPTATPATKAAAASTPSPIRSSGK